MRESEERKLITDSSIRILKDILCISLEYLAPSQYVIAGQAGARENQRVIGSTVRSYGKESKQT